MMVATRTYSDSLSVATVYAAEGTVKKSLQLGGTVQFHGSTLDLRGNTLKEYGPAEVPLVTGIIAGLYLRHRGEDRPATAPTLRVSTKAYRHAWYSPSAHEIVLPARAWAWNSLTVAHEVGHAVTATGHNQRSSHGHEWRRAYAAIVRDLIGPEASLLLMEAMDL